MAGDLGAVLSEINVLREAIGPALELAGRKQAIVFTVTRGHMHAAAETTRQMAAERRLPLEVATVDGTTPTRERDDTMARFRDGRINWLVNVGVATEGFDAPGIEVVIMLRPTMSLALHAQMLGRGTRPLAGTVDGLTIEDACVMTDLAQAQGRMPDGPWIERALKGTHEGDLASARRLAIALSAKPELLVIDFAANSTRHDLATPLDMLGGDYTLPERRDAERLLVSGSARNLLDALEQARAARQSMHVEQLARAGDPFALFGLTPSPDRLGREATPKQLAALGPMPRRMDRREANQMLAEIERRRDAGLCLYSQAAILARLGHPVAQLRTLTRKAASKAVRAAAESGWQPP